MRISGGPQATQSGVGKQRPLDDDTFWGRLRALASHAFPVAGFIRDIPRTTTLGPGMPIPWVTERFPEVRMRMPSVGPTTPMVNAGLNFAQDIAQELATRARGGDPTDWLSLAAQRFAQEQPPWVAQPGGFPLLRWLDVPGNLLAERIAAARGRVPGQQLNDPSWRGAGATVVQTLMPEFYGEAPTTMFEELYDLVLPGDPTEAPAWRRIAASSLGILGELATDPGVVAALGFSRVHAPGRTVGPSATFAARQAASSWHLDPALAGGIVDDIRAATLGFMRTGPGVDTRAVVFGETQVMNDLRRTASSVLRRAGLEPWQAENFTANYLRHFQNELGVRWRFFGRPIRWGTNNRNTPTWTRGEATLRGQLYHEYGSRLGGELADDMVGAMERHYSLRDFPSPGGVTGADLLQGRTSTRIGRSPMPFARGLDGELAMERVAEVVRRRVPEATPQELGRITAAVDMAETGAWAPIGRLRELDLRFGPAEWGTAPQEPMMGVRGMIEQLGVWPDEVGTLGTAPRSRLQELLSTRARRLQRPVEGPPAPARTVIQEVSQYLPRPVRPGRIAQAVEQGEAVAMAPERVRPWEWPGLREGAYSQDQVWRTSVRELIRQHGSALGVNEAVATAIARQHGLGEAGVRSLVQTLVETEAAQAATFAAEVHGRIRVAEEAYGKERLRTEQEISRKVGQFDAYVVRTRRDFFRARRERLNWERERQGYMPAPAAGVDVPPSRVTPYQLETQIRQFGITPPAPGTQATQKALPGPSAPQPSGLEEQFLSFIGQQAQNVTDETFPALPAHDPQNAEEFIQQSPPHRGLYEGLRAAIMLADVTRTSLPENEIVDLMTQAHGQGVAENDLQLIAEMAAEAARSGAGHRAMGRLAELNDALLTWTWRNVADDEDTSEWAKYAEELEEEAPAAPAAPTGPAPAQLTIEGETEQQRVQRSSLEERQGRPTAARGRPAQIGFDAFAPETGQTTLGEFTGDDQQMLGREGYGYDRTTVRGQVEPEGAVADAAALTGDLKRTYDAVGEEPLQIDLWVADRAGLPVGIVGPALERLTEMGLLRRSQQYGQTRAGGWAYSKPPVPSSRPEQPAPEFEPMPDLPEDTPTSLAETMRAAPEETAPARLGRPELGALISARGRYSRSLAGPLKEAKAFVDGEEAVLRGRLRKLKKSDPEFAPLEAQLAEVVSLRKRINAAPRGQTIRAIVRRRLREEPQKRLRSVLARMRANSPSPHERILGASPRYSIWGAMAEALGGGDAMNYLRDFAFGVLAEPDVEPAYRYDVRVRAGRSSDNSADFSTTIAFDMSLAEGFDYWRELQGNEEDTHWETLAENLHDFAHELIERVEDSAMLEDAATGVMEAAENRIEAERWDAVHVALIEVLQDMQEGLATHEDLSELLTSISMDESRAHMLEPFYSVVDEEPTITSELIYDVMDAYDAVFANVDAGRDPLQGRAQSGAPTAKRQKSIGTLEDEAEDLWEKIDLRTRTLNAYLEYIGSNERFPEDWQDEIPEESLHGRAMRAAMDERGMTVRAFGAGLVADLENVRDSIASAIEGFGEDWLDLFDEDGFALDVWFPDAVRAGVVEPLRADPPTTAMSAAQAAGHVEAVYERALAEARAETEREAAEPAGPAPARPAGMPTDVSDLPVPPPEGLTGTYLEEFLLAFLEWGPADFNDIAMAIEVVTGETVHGPLAGRIAAAALVLSMRPELGMHVDTGHVYYLEHAKNRTRPAEWWVPEAERTAKAVEAQALRDRMQTAPADPGQTAILTALAQRDLPIALVGETAGIPPAQASANLMLLELRGLLKQDIINRMVSITPAGRAALAQTPAEEPTMPAAEAAVPEVAPEVAAEPEAAQAAPAAETLGSDEALAALLQAVAELDRQASGPRLEEHLAETMPAAQVAATLTRAISNGLVAEGAAEELWLTEAGQAQVGAPAPPAQEAIAGQVSSPAPGAKETPAPEGTQAPAAQQPAEPTVVYETITPERVLDALRTAPVRMLQVRVPSEGKRPVSGPKVEGRWTQALTTEELAAAINAPEPEVQRFMALEMADGLTVAQVRDPEWGMGWARLLSQREALSARVRDFEAGRPEQGRRPLPQAQPAAPGASRSSRGRAARPETPFEVPEGAVAAGSQTWEDLPEQFRPPPWEAGAGERREQALRLEREQLERWEADFRAKRELELRVRERDLATLRDLEAAHLARADQLLNQIRTGAIDDQTRRTALALSNASIREDADDILARNLAKRQGGFRRFPGWKAHHADAFMSTMAGVNHFASAYAHDANRAISDLNDAECEVVTILLAMAEPRAMYGNLRTLRRGDTIHYSPRRRVEVLLGLLNFDQRLAARIVNDQGEVDLERMPARAREVWQAHEWLRTLSNDVFYGDNGFTSAQAASRYVSDVSGDPSMRWKQGYVSTFRAPAITWEERQAARRYAQATIEQPSSYPDPVTMVHRFVQLMERAARLDQAGDEAQAARALEEAYNALPRINISTIIAAYTGSYQYLLSRAAVYRFVTTYMPTMQEIIEEVGEGGLNGLVDEGWGRLTVANEPLPGLENYYLPPAYRRFIEARYLEEVVDAQLGQLIEVDLDAAVDILANFRPYRIAREVLHPAQVALLKNRIFVLAQLAEQAFNLWTEGVLTDRFGWTALEAFAMNNRILAQGLLMEDQRVPYKTVAGRWKVKAAEIIDRATEGVLWAFHSQGADTRLIKQLLDEARSSGLYTESFGVAGRMELAGFAERMSRLGERRGFVPRMVRQMAGIDDAINTIVFGIDSLGRGTGYVARRLMGDSQEEARRVVRNHSVEYGSMGMSPAGRLLGSLFWYWTYTEQRMRQLPQMAMRYPWIVAVAEEVLRKKDRWAGLDAEWRAVANGRPQWMRGALEWTPVPSANPVVRGIRRGDTITDVDGRYLFFIRLRWPGFEEPGRWAQMAARPFSEIGDMALPYWDILQTAERSDQVSRVLAAVPVVGRWATRLAKVPLGQGLAQGLGAQWLTPMPEELATLMVDNGAVPAQVTADADRHKLTGARRRTYMIEKLLFYADMDLATSSSGISVYAVPAEQMLQRMTINDLRRAEIAAERKLAADIPVAFTPKRYREELREREEGTGPRDVWDQMGAVQRGAVHAIQDAAAPTAREESSR